MDFKSLINPTLDLNFFVDFDCQPKSNFETDGDSHLLTLITTLNSIFQLSPITEPDFHS